MVIYNMSNKRNRIERWLDRHNHTMEFIRTLVAITSGCHSHTIIWEIKKWNFSKWFKYSNPHVIEFFNSNSFFNPNSNKSWKLIAKIGTVLIGIGLLIFILKELIIGILSTIFIGLGTYCLYMAYNIWNSTRL